MTSTTSEQQTLGTEHAPVYLEGPTEIVGDIHLHQRYYTYMTDEGLVVGKTMNVMFTIDRPAREVWPFLKDLNLWQNPYDHHYSGVVGDLEGQTFELRLGASSPVAYLYEVVRVIPEQLIVARQPIPEDGSTGGISPGFHVFLLNEHGGKTIVTVLMQHASRSKDLSFEEALKPWQTMAPDSQMKWRDIFIPALRSLVYEASKR